MAHEVAADDPFDEFLSAQEPPAGVDANATSMADDPNVQLRLMVECSQRQEQLLGKVCSLLADLGEKVDRIAQNQDRLEARLAAVAPAGSAACAAAAGAPVTPTPTRGQMVMPLGHGGQPAQVPQAGSGAAASGYPGAKAGEDPRLAAERLAADAKRVEEESRRRAEELARKREDDERRRREEAERIRIEEERKKEEERLRKLALEKKTTGLMSDLITSGGGGGLFGDDEPRRPKKGGGLFDD